MSASPVPHVSVVIPVLNGEKTIRNCLVSLLRMDYPAERREILVVDNGSTDRTHEIATAYPVRCLTEARRGLSYARNRGIEASSGEFIAFTDADCNVSTAWLRELMLGFQQDAVSCVVGEVVAYPPQTPAERYFANRKPRWQEWTRHGRRLPWFLFSNAVVRRKVFDRVGLFDTRFSGVAAEDIDFSWRFHRAKMQLAYRPRAIVFHRHRTTTRGLFRQQVRVGRGQALLCAKYPKDLPWGWREELTAWGDLGLSGWRALQTESAARAPGGSASDFEHAYCDFLRKLAQRMGFGLGSIAGRLARPERLAERGGKVQRTSNPASGESDP